MAGEDNEFQLIRRRPPLSTLLNHVRHTAHPSGLVSIRFDATDFSDYQALARLQSQLIAVDRQNQVRCFLELCRAGVWPLLLEFHRARPDRAFQPDYVDLWNLYHYVVSSGPAVIWEFGSGLSTLVMAYALERNGAGKLFSLEPSEAWAAFTGKALPSHLRNRCEVLHSPGETCRIGTRETVRFARRPDVMPDFVYVDGAPAGARWLGAEDIYFLEPELRRGFAVLIDGRFEALRFFDASLLSRAWQVETEMIALEVSTVAAVGLPFALDQYANSLVRLMD